MSCGTLSRDGVGGVDEAVQLKPNTFTIPPCHPCEPLSLKIINSKLLKVKLSRTSAHTFQVCIAGEMASDAVAHTELEAALSRHESGLPSMPVVSASVLQG